MKKQNNTKRVHSKHNASKKGYKHTVQMSKGQIAHIMYISSQLDSVKINN